MEIGFQKKKVATCWYEYSINSIKLWAGMSHGRPPPVLLHHGWGRGGDGASSMEGDGDEEGTAVDLATSRGSTPPAAAPHLSPPPPTHGADPRRPDPSTDTSAGVGYAAHKPAYCRCREVRREGERTTGEGENPAAAFLAPPGLPTVHSGGSKGGRRGAIRVSARTAATSTSAAPSQGEA